MKPNHWLIAITLALAACSPSETRVQVLNVSDAVRLVERTDSYRAYAARISGSPKVLIGEPLSPDVSDAIFVNVGEDRETHFTRGESFKVTRDGKVFRLVDADSDALSVWKPE